MSEHQTSVVIEVPGVPRGKGSIRVASKGAYTDPKTLDMMMWVKHCARHWTQLQPILGPLQVVLVAYMPVPRSWAANRTAEALRGMLRPTVKPDCDNIAKLYLDPLNGLVWRDDAQIVELTVRKLYCTNPRVIITVMGITQ